MHQPTCRRISSVTTWTPLCWGLRLIFLCSQAGWPIMIPAPMPEVPLEPLLWLAEHAMAATTRRLALTQRSKTDAQIHTICSHLFSNVQFKVFDSVFLFLSALIYLLSCLMQNFVNPLLGSEMYFCLEPGWLADQRSGCHSRGSTWALAVEGRTSHSRGRQLFTLNLFARISKFC